MGAILGRMATIAWMIVVLLTGGPVFAGHQPESVRVPIALNPIDSNAHTVTVIEGDHLWKISKRHLETHMQNPPGDDQVAPYWRTVIDVNLDRLRSGDPNLIYPGEVIHLPDLPVSEQP